MAKIENVLSYLDTAPVKNLNTVELIEKLGRRIDHSRSKQYCFFAAQRGDNCSFAKGSLEKFEQHDLGDIKDLVLQLADRLRESDG